MALLQAFDPSANPLNNNDWAFPLLEIIHISGFAIAIGTVAAVDFCMVGGGNLLSLAAPLWRATSKWTLIGLAMVLLSGPLIFTTDPYMYFYNQGFRFKMGVLLLALVFQYTIHRKVTLGQSSSPGISRLVGLVSLVLWITVVFGGIFIAF